MKGKTFKTRYRVRNIEGWSDFSPFGYLLAA